MITDHKYRPMYKADVAGIAKGNCPFNGTCNKPKEEHAASVNLKDKRRPSSR